MRYLKMPGLAALAMAAVLAFTGSASATTLTSPAGTTLGVGAKIKASATEGITTGGSIFFICQKSTIEAEVENPGGASTTVKAPISSFTFAECAPSVTLTILKPGTLEFHTRFEEGADGSGRLTWSGAEVTVLTHNFFAGTTHCIYSTENTFFGTIGGSSNTGETANLWLTDPEVPSEVPLKATDPGCGESFGWTTGSYVFETPDYLDVD